MITNQIPARHATGTATGTATGNALHDAPRKARRARLTSRFAGVALIAIGASIAMVPTAQAADKTTKAKTVDQVDSIEEYFGGGDSSKRINKKINESIQKCMKREGFDYKIPPDGPPFPDNPADEKSNADFAKKWGYGISTSFSADAATDPNAAAMAKMSEADRTAFQTALVGKNTTSPTGDPKSCVGKAIALIGDITKITALFGRYEKEVTKKLATDPKVVEAMKKWSSCMKEGGFIYAKDSEVPPAFTAKMQKLMTGATPPAKTDPKLLELQKLERDTSVKDVQCTFKHLKVRLELKKELDRSFIKKNQAEVDAFRTSLTK